MLLTGFELNKGKSQQRKAQETKEASFQRLLKDQPELALDRAIAERSAELVRAALAKGASLETASRSGLTRMHQAAKNGRIEELRFLQQMGANVNALSKVSETPLLFALQYDHGATVDFLASCPDCDPNLENNKKISPLNYVLDKGKIAQVIALMKNPRVKATQFIAKFKAHIKAKDSAQAKLMVGCQVWLEKLSQDERSELLNTALEQGADLAIIQKLFFNQKILFDMPFANTVYKHEHFDSKEKIKAFLALDEPLSYIESHQLATPVAMIGLNILQIAEHVKILDQTLDEYGEEENAMADKKVKHANRHFKEVVEPYLKDKFLSYSRRKDRKQALLAIEQDIRKLLLEEIMQKAVSSDNKKIINFIRKNKRSLTLGGPKAMEASVGVLTELTAEQAAWRGYNPYAPVSGEWDNLLTSTDTDDIWKTDAAKEGDKLSGEEATRVVRERVAHYFLAVMEGNDEALKCNRIVNFIEILAEIRNAKGINNPSCFPGTLTRAAQMGAFHEIVQLPPTFEEKLSELLKSKVLALFQEKFARLTTLKEKRDLLNALVGLTQVNAIDIIKNQNAFPSALLPIRQSFIDALGSPIKIFEEVKEALDYEVEDEELICVNQHLLDPARGDIAVALQEYFDKQLDTVPSVEEKAQANPFSKEQALANQLAAFFLASIEKQLAFYFQSKRKLLSLTEFIQQKIPIFVRNGLRIEDVASFFESLDGTAEAKHRASQECIAACEAQGLIQPKIILQNPYTDTIATIKGQMAPILQPSVLKSRLESMLLKAEQKRDLFDNLRGKLEESIKQAGKQLPDVPEFLKALTEHVFEHNGVKTSDFEKDFEPSQVTFLQLPCVQQALEIPKAKVVRKR